MKVLMMTNTYKPHVGGVARSVSFFSDEYRKLDHEVLVVAPTFEGIEKEDNHVVRVPAIQNFNGSDFSVVLPIPGFLRGEIEDFQPDIVHSHHPFLLGDSAVRIANKYDLPIVFTHHTMYEQYTHYVPGDSDQMKRFVIELATGYANMCDHVIAPSASIAKILRKRGVKTPIKSIPTGVYTRQFSRGNGEAFRRKLKISEEALVIGHLGRLAPEKNLPFLSTAVSGFLEKGNNSHFLVIGNGPSEETILKIFKEKHLVERLHLGGSLQGQDLIDAYHAMDIFAFASKSETQGMVLVEAMAAGLPVVAIDAPGAREVVKDQVNGRLLMAEDTTDFVNALCWYYDQPAKVKEDLQQAAKRTAQRFSMRRCARRTLEIYEQLITKQKREAPIDNGLWQRLVNQIETEWNMLTNVSAALTTTVVKTVEELFNEDNETEKRPEDNS